MIITGKHRDVVSVSKSRSRDGLETYFWKLKGLGLVSVSNVKVSFHKLKYSVYHTFRTLVKVNFSYYTENTKLTTFTFFKFVKKSFFST